MASMQMCKPACESTFSETDKVKYSMTQAGHHVDGIHQKRLIHKNNYSQGINLSEHRHHENKPAGCATNQGGHHMGGMVHKQPNHSAGHHGLTEKISEYLGYNGSSHGHKHGHQSSSYAYTEKKEEHKISKTGHGKTEVYIKKKTSKKGKSSDDSSGSESDGEGCKKRC